MSDESINVGKSGRAKRSDKFNFQGMSTYTGPGLLDPAKKKEKAAG